MSDNESTLVQTIDEASKIKANKQWRQVSDGGRRILDLLLKTGGLSQADITRSLDLSQPTVARLLQSFQQDEIVQVSSRQVDRPGNPSVHVRLNPDFCYSFGVSMLGDVLSLILMDFSGSTLSYRTHSMPSMSQRAVIETLTRFRAELISEAKIDPARIVGAGVGISGFFVGEGRLMNPPEYLKEWALIDIDPIIAEALHVPVTVDNDGTVAAIAESLFGVGRSCENFAYLQLTNGFGGGLISNGRANRGHHGNAGEFGGVWTLCDEGYPNLDLLQSCLAAHGHTFTTVEDMVQVIDVTWEGVEDWIQLAAKPFSMLAGLLAYILDPEKIVIGGRLPASIAQALVNRIQIPKPANRWGHPLPLPKVVVSEVKGDSVAMGAAAIPLQRAFFI